MNGWLWLLAGLLVGALNVASIARTVGRLQPKKGRLPAAAPQLAALSLMTSGFVLRLLVSVLVLIVALRQSAASGLLAFAGLWLGRWTVLFWVNVPGDRREIQA